MFRLMYLGIGLVLAISLLRLQVMLGCPAWMSAATTIAFVTSPACALYECHLFYTYPMLALLCLSAVLVHEYARSGRDGCGITLFSTLAAIVLTRSVFHILWFVAVIGLLLVGLPGRRRQAALLALIPFVLAFAWYAKNWVVFGQFSASSWLGMSLSKFTTCRLLHQEPDTVRRLVDKRVLSPLSLRDPYLPVEAYTDLFVMPPKFANIPALAETHKSTGPTNYNHIAYSVLSKQSFSDAVALIRVRPDVYRSALGDACETFFLPADDYHFVEENRRRIQRMDSFYDHHFCTPACNEALFGIGLLFGVVAAVVALRGGPRRRAEALTILYMVGTIVFVTVVGIAGEFGENNRYRFNIDPFLVALLGLLLGGVVRRAGNAIQERNTV